jgi:hypothetical protein
MSKKRKLPGSSSRKIERLLRRGWSPGRTFGEVLARKQKQQPQACAAGGHNGQ